MNLSSFIMILNLETSFIIHFLPILLRTFQSKINHIKMFHMIPVITLMYWKV